MTCNDQSSLVDGAVRAEVNQVLSFMSVYALEYCCGCFINGHNGIMGIL